jgi:hypothetical protein
MNVLGELHFDYFLELRPQASLDFLYKCLRRFSPGFEILLDKISFDAIGIITREFSGYGSVPPRE